MMVFIRPAKTADTRRSRRLGATLLAALIALTASAPLAAQLALPGPLGTAGGIGLGGLGGGFTGQPGSQIKRLAPARALDPIDSAVPLRSLRRQAINDLLRQHGDEIEADPAGEPVARAELLLVAPTDLQLAAVLARGFVVLRIQTLQALDLRNIVLQPPIGMSTVSALTRLRAIDPQIEADFNHVYTRSGSLGGAAKGGLPIANGPVAARSQTTRVGLIDGGVDLEHPALRRADRRLWGCDGKAVPSPHGTAVASLLVGRDAGFAGVTPTATLYAADIYCGRAGGGSAAAVAEALAWMAAERVAVVNVSLVGSPNKLLERAIGALIERGHLIVAAVGNDGPAAAVLYPAAYAGVIGVTGVDPRRVVLPEAGQGVQVMFAAPGSGIAVAQSSRSDYVSARGTSFAAPLVAGLLATLLPDPDRAAARLALNLLIDQALDLGATGRDLVYGFGLVAEQQRIDARQLQASKQAGF